MRMILSLAVAFAATSAFAADFDAKKLEGTWTFKSGMKAGTKAADESLKGEVVIKGDMMKMPLGDMVFDIKLVTDGKKTPVEVDLEITKGPVGEGEKRKGILSLEGDELKICYPADGSADRPTKFDGEKNHLFVLTKKKAK
jgi:uncharacterized protein (TIGR03067 family)